MAWTKTFCPVCDAAVAAPSRDAYRRNQPPTVQVVKRSGGGVVFWVSFFFGVFGLIPAAVYAGAAVRDGRDGLRYWKLFGMGFACSVVLVVSVVSMIITNNPLPLAGLIAIGLGYGVYRAASP